MTYIIEMEKENENFEQKKEIDIVSKTHICYSNSNFETTINIFFQKIKPMEGIVKYKMVEWTEFPTSVEEAKSMSLEWRKRFQLSNTYINFKVGVYFYLTSKTIKFELKQKNLLIKLEQNDIVDVKILSSNYILGKTIIFDCVKTKYFMNFDLSMCKLKGKELALKLEFQYSPNKFVVFLNPSLNFIQITMK